MSTHRAVPTDRGAAAVDLLGVLYPSPCEVLVAPRSGTAVRRSWTAIPSAQNPRLLVPGSGPAATRMLRRQLTGRRARTRLARGVLSLLAGSGVPAHVPQLRLAVTGPVGAPSIEDPLRAALGLDDLRIAMPVGPARSTRKPVLQVSDDAGRVHAFAKVGHSALTNGLVRAEAASLRTLDGVAPLLTDIRFPRTLVHVTWRGCEVLVLEPLEIPASRLSGAAARARLLAVVEEISSIGGRSSVTWGEHPYRATILARAARCGDEGDALRRHVEQVSPGRELTTGSWHGDLNPGNIALVDGPCPVWDWERFESGVPVGFDLLHHELHQLITVRGTAPQAAATRLLSGARELLVPLGIDDSVADTVARLYLVTLGCRYLADDQRGAGADLGGVSEWLLPALEEVTT